MGFELNRTFPQYNMTPQLLYSSPSLGISKTETEEEKLERLKKEEAQKAATEFQARMDAIKNNSDPKTVDNMNAPLTEKEKELIKNTILENSEIDEGSLATSMLFTTPFLTPTVLAAIKSKKNTIRMFYKDSAQHMDLFKRNPDLMINSQESMQKLERKFIKDYNAAKGDRILQANIAQERKIFRDMMQKALQSNNPEEIAKVTEQLNVAKSVKNGKFARWYRKYKKQPLINSRFDAVAAADGAGRFSSVKPPKEGTSFFKNLFSSKLTGLMTAGMAILPIIFDWGNIQKARTIDKENKQKGKDTDYATEQIMQTGIKSTASAITYTVTDTAARTLTKKLFGKFAAKLATKIALKGGCKILGTAIGSIFPGAGTAIGLLAGTAADFLLNKYVFGNMEFFKNTAVTKAELKSGSDEKLICQISDQYSMGTNIKDKKLLELLKRKCGTDNFNKMQQMHNMSEEQRNAYIEMIAKEQQAQQEDQVKQAQQQTQAQAA